MRPLPSLAVAVFASLVLACPQTPAPPPPPTGPGPMPPTAPPIPGVPTAPAPPPAPMPPALPGGGGGSITIAPGGGGGFAIQGAPALHGDPAACAAFQACCGPHQGQLSPPGLACGLAPASTNGDCAAALQSIRAIFTEQGIALPMGCAP